MASFSQAMSSYVKGALRYSGEFSHLVVRWPDIVGVELSKYCSFEKIVFPKGKRSAGRLYVRASSSFSVHIYNYKRLILERVNASFSYPAIQELIVVHGVIKDSQQSPPPLKRSHQPSTPPLSLKVSSIMPKELCLKESLASLFKTLQEGRV